MYYYLYRVTNKVNGKIYVGVHKTQRLDDGYMGSGKVILASVKKYGLENFEKEILETFDNAADMFKREAEVVTEEFLARPDVYNLRRGGSGGFDYINANPSEAKMRAQKANALKAHIGYREKIASDPQFRKKMASNLDGSKSKRFRGKRHTPETKSKMRKTKNVGETNSQHGTFWITDGTVNKKSRGPIPEGWYRGRNIG